MKRIEVSNWQAMVGRLVTKGDNDAWRVIGYCESPSVILENLDTKERIDTGIYGLSAQGWSPLVPGTDEDTTPTEGASHV